MNVALWVVQGLLALVFLMSGSMKAFTPLATMRKKMTCASGFPATFVRFLGVAELLGTIGLIAPAVTGIQSWLTVAAAVGFVVVMVSAFVFHTSRREYQNIGDTCPAPGTFALCYGKGICDLEVRSELGPAHFFRDAKGKNSWQKASSATSFLP